MSDKQDALRAFVAKSRAQLQQLLQRLNWTEEGVQKLHRSLPHPDEIVVEQLPPSCCTATEHSVQLNAEVLQQLLPGKQLAPIDSFEDLQSNYSAEQKLILYEHVLSCTPRQPLSFEQQANFAELVAETKRAHQKARRHRKSKMTLLEEMHQLVHLQMQALTQQQQQQEQHEQQDQYKQQQQRLASSERSERRKAGKYDGRRESRSRSRSRSRGRIRKMKRRSRSRSNQRSIHNYNKKRSSRVQRSSRTPDRRRGRSQSPHRRRCRSRSPKHSRRHGQNSSASRKGNQEARRRPSPRRGQISR